MRTDAIILRPEPLPPRRVTSEQLERHLQDWSLRARSAVLYYSYFEWKEASQRKLDCSLAPCNLTTHQNAAQVFDFLRTYGLLNGRMFLCHHSETLDPNVVFVSLLSNQVPALAHLLSWPLVFAALGIVSLIGNSCLMGCGVWKDAVLV